MRLSGHRVCAICALLLAACADDGTGRGAAASGGASGSGGVSASGGQSGPGGNATVGGSAATGGTSAAADAGPLDAGDSATFMDAGPDASDASSSSDARTPDAAADAGDGCPSPIMAPVIVQSGVGSLLLRGMVVTPDQAFEGEVLVVGDTIACVAPSCDAEGGAAAASVVDTHGIIFPGLIDTHNHVFFDAFDSTDWTPSQAYANHTLWTAEPRYAAMVDAKQYLAGEGGSPIDLGCELDKYGELKGLVAGTTSIVAAASNRTCFGSLARTIDQASNDLGSDSVRTALLPSSTAIADSVCNSIASGVTKAYLVHLAEGVDATALNEFAALRTRSTVPDCLLDPHTTIVHGTALGDPEFSLMAQHGMSLVWSPRSNVVLYGGGTDLSKTTNVPLALSKGINVAIGPDWSLTGSQNLLDELRFAKQVDSAEWGNQLTSKALVQMVTSNAAKVLGMSGILGSLAPGRKADITVIAGDTCAPYDALLGATPSDIRFVMVGGVALYGDQALASLGPAAPGCETLAICGVSKFVCVAESGGNATNKFGQTYAQIESALSSALTTYDTTLNFSGWTFSPLAPLVQCP